MDAAQTREYLLDQLRRYPLLQPEDLLKALHQSVFGPGHFVTDEAAALARLEAELAAGGFGEGPDTEPLDGPFCRVHLRTLERTGLRAETLARAFVLSAQRGPAGDAAALEQKLEILTALAEEGALSFSPEVLKRLVTGWREEGFPARHHSEAFRAAYTPAYRVLRRDLAQALPLLAAIDRTLVEKERVVVALEGGSASGKTTLAATLETLYGCTVFHMDDFFLQPHQRTAQRLAEPGGNVDRERFREEVLRPLKRGETVSYRRYDCHSQTLQPPVSVLPGRLTVVEGAYSMHPDLADSYDLSVFLKLSPQLQRQRIQRRNPDLAERFFRQWIPLEAAYFAAMDPAGRLG